MARNTDWLVGQSTYQGDNCLVWPFGYSSDGYGIVQFEGQIQNAHRAMCTIAHGECPSPDHMAAHTCGNGNKGCVNPRHLAWQTWSENAFDRTTHGTQATGKRGKLTYATAQEIRALRGKMKHHEIAALFGTTRANVTHIMRGITHNKPLKGVFKSGKRFKARFRIDGRDTTIGIFDTPEQAAAAYQAKLASVSGNRTLKTR